MWRDQGLELVLQTVKCILSKDVFDFVRMRKKGGVAGRWSTTAGAKETPRVVVLSKQSKVCLRQGSMRGLWLVVVVMRRRGGAMDLLGL
jgi:hypothetical protein